MSLIGSPVRAATEHQESGDVLLVKLRNPSHLPPEIVSDWTTERCPRCTW